MLAIVKDVSLKIERACVKILLVNLFNVSRKAVLLFTISFLSLLGGKASAQYFVDSFEQEMRNTAADYIDDAADWMEKWEQPNVPTRKRCTYASKVLANLEMAIAYNSNVRNISLNSPRFKTLGDIKFYLENWRVDNCGW